MKLWYLSSFFRYERPQAGRFRQFWQIGAEAIGSADPAVDAELILLLGELLEAIGAREVKLVLATLGQPDARAAYREELKAYLRAHEDQLSEEVRSRIDLNPLRAFDAKHASTQRVMADAPRLIDRLPQDDLDHFGEVRYLLDQADMPHEVDTTLVRGLDYYTRTLFEFQSGALEAAQNTLGGGGRYDNLAEQIGGPHTPGMGWAAGVERMLMASTQADAGAAARRSVRRLRARPQGARVQARRRRAARGRVDKTRTRRAAASRASSSRPRAAALATLPSSATRASSCATARVARTSSSRRNPSCTTSGDECETTAREPVPRRLGRGAGRRTGG